MQLLAYAASLREGRHMPLHPQLETVLQKLDCFGPFALIAGVRQ